jgi:hypothetical protein
MITLFWPSATEKLIKHYNSKQKYVRVLIFHGTRGLFYKPITIVNDESSIVNKLEASLTDDARVIIYDHHMFTVQATVVNL